MAPLAVTARAPLWRQRAKMAFFVYVWPRRWRISLAISGYFLMRLCQLAPLGWPFTLCELVHRLLKVFGA